MSARALAPHVGRSHAAVALWVKRDDWPFGEGPWPVSLVPQIKTWAANTLREDRSAGADDEASDHTVKPDAAAGLTAALDGMSIKGKLEARYRMAAIKRLELQVEQLKIDMGKYVPMQQVEATLVDRTLRIRAQLMNTARILAAIERHIQPGHEAECEDDLRKLMRSICDLFAGTPATHSDETPQG